MGERSLMGGTQNHAGHFVCLECFLPSGRTQTPTIARLEACKAVFRHWSRQIIPARFGKFEKLGGHYDADCMAPNVLSPGVATAIPVKPGHGPDRADFQGLAEHVTGPIRPPTSITAIVSEHAVLPGIASEDGT